MTVVAPSNTPAQSTVVSRNAYIYQAGFHIREGQIQQPRPTREDGGEHASGSLCGRCVGGACKHRSCCSCRLQFPQCLIMFYFFTTSTSAPGLDGLKPSTGSAGYQSSSGSSVDKGTTPKPVDSLPPATAPGSRMNATVRLRNIGTCCNKH